MDIITPIANKDGMVFYMQNSLNIQRIFGICPSDFLQMHANLAERDLKVITTDTHAQVDFVFYCHALVMAGADVRTLIHEFNTSQKGDGTDLIHALSLAKLYYHYNTAGYKVHIQRTNKSVSTADLVIDNVKCDVKVRHDQTYRRMNKYRNLLSGGKHNEYHEILSNEIRSLQKDLESALTNRAEEGFGQSDCVILDLSDHFYSWNYHRLKSLQETGSIQGLSTSPIPAVTSTCILFSPDNARDLNRIGFNPKAYWGYLPIDGRLIQDKSDAG